MTNIYKPILFSTPMVQAILRGNKTQTRRIVNPQPQPGELPGKPKYNVGDIMWVRETWRPKGHSMPTGPHYEYRATAQADGVPTDEPWKPSIFMPREACRIFLKVTNVRIERLEDITKEDAIAEGIEMWQQQGCTRYKSYVKPMVGFWDIHNGTGGVHAAIASFRSLWASINGFDSLNSNPWVYVYDFEVAG